MSSILMRRVQSAAACALVILVGSVACGSSDAAPRTPTPAPLATSAAWNYAVFGDSWPHGSHCNGCKPFPTLYADGIKEKTGHPVTFEDLTINGGDSGSLLKDLQTQDAARQAAAGADIIVISTGGNDLEEPFYAWQTGTCGGKDKLSCFRTTATKVGRNFDQLLAAVQTLRSGKPTAVRVLTNSNEFLSDPGLISAFGANAAKDGAIITALMHDAECAAAAKNHVRCIDLRPILNGPKYDQPQDVNTQTAMQHVAEALVAAGLSELSTTH
jgi:lysophospholipase L1-like esterase